MDLCPNCRWPQIDAETCSTCSQPIKHRCRCSSPSAQPRLAGRYPRAEHEHYHDNQVTDCAFCQHEQTMIAIRESKKKANMRADMPVNLQANFWDGWVEALSWVEGLIDDER